MEVEWVIFAFYGKERTTQRVVLKIILERGRPRPYLHLEQKLS